MAAAKSTTDDRPDYLVMADRIVAAMPKPLRDRVTVESGGGKYGLIKLDGRKTLMSVRSKNVRVTLAHDGTSQAARDLGAVAAGAAARADAAAPAEKLAKKPAAKKDGEAPTGDEAA